MTQIEILDTGKTMAELTIRKAYREGQANMLRKIKSIVKTYYPGEEKMLRDNILEYCNDYIPECENDVRICEENINLL